MKYPLVNFFLLALAGRGLANDASGQIPLVKDEVLGDVGAMKEHETPLQPADYKFEMFPITGVHCPTAKGTPSTWSADLLKAGGLDYINKQRQGTVGPEVAEAYDPKSSSGVKSFKAAFDYRCTKTENIRQFYMVHDENIGHLGYGLDEANRILYLCFMFGQDIDGISGSGGECSYY